MNTNTDSCPQCKQWTGEKNRLIAESSCGHKKCRQCFLEDEEQCRQCDEQLETEQKTEATSVAQKQEQKESGSEATTITTTSTKLNPNEQQSENRIKTSCITITKHIQKERTNDGRLEYHCTVCQKRFGSRTQQYYHLACGNQQQQQRYKCDPCNKHFASRSHLNYHLESHDTQSYKCNECNKTFGKLTIFKKHQKLHRQLPVQCTLCDRQFRHANSLQAHMAMHANVLRYACELCEKRYARKSTLQQHVLKHSEKKHQCPQCNKKFQRNSILKLHLRRHSAPECSHNCTHCCKTFKEAGALLRHSKMHSDAIKYKCTVCDVLSIRKDNILRHIRNMHADNSAAGCVEIYATPTESPLSAAVNATTTIADKTLVMRPKTVENSAVIKSVGNVKPVVVVPQLFGEATESTTCAQPTLTTLETVQLTTLQTAPLTTVAAHAHKKYNPIEMYRKILNSGECLAPDEDEEEDEEDDNDVEEVNNLTSQQVLPKAAAHKTKPAVLEQQRFAQNQSNFSEMHWRKNYKYTYEYQDF